MVKVEADPITWLAEKALRLHALRADDKLRYKLAEQIDDFSTANASLMAVMDIVGSKLHEWVLHAPFSRNKGLISKVHSVRAEFVFFTQATARRPGRLG